LKIILNINEDFIVAVSGGPDSLALSFLAKIYSIKKSLNVKYFIVDHKLRKILLRGKICSKTFKKIFNNLKYFNLEWNKTKKNIQSIARDKRYELLINKAKKLKLKIFY
jgi:tRNA(Ile)-lysidine synthase